MKTEKLLNGVGLTGQEKELLVDAMEHLFEKAFDGSDTPEEMVEKLNNLASLGRKLNIPNGWVNGLYEDTSWHLTIEGREDFEQWK